METEDSGLPRVLFLSPGREEYLSDGLLHGLRQVLGDRLVDYPKCEILYETCPEPIVRAIRGYGFTLYGLLEDIPISRGRILEQFRWREFDLAVFADIRTSFGFFVELLPDLKDLRVAILDGTDETSIYPYAGKWLRFRPWRFLPRAHMHFPYFKRELHADATFYRYYGLLPRRVCRALPLPRNLRPIAFSVPEEKIVDHMPRKDKLFPAHIVDPEVAASIDGATSYAFESEADYYQDLQRSSYGITMKRGGWDCLRHYEIAANGCVPCFRDLQLKPPTCAPHGLDDSNCITYTSYADLTAKIDGIDDERYGLLQRGAVAWARRNSTKQRALQFLETMGFAIEASTAPQPFVPV